MLSKRSPFFGMGLDDLTKVSGVIIYSLTGTRIIGKYYDNIIAEDQLNNFENEIFSRGVEDQYGEVMQHESFIVVYRVLSDFIVFIVGSLKSNELLLSEVLNTIISALELVYKKKLSTKTLVNQIDLLYLLLDETIEHGFIFEGDPEIVAARSLLKDDNALIGKALRTLAQFT